MTPDEYLNSLIERREHGEEWRSAANDDIAVRMTAAEALAHLQKVEVPPEFASRLETQIRAHARGLPWQETNGIVTPWHHPRGRGNGHRSVGHRAWMTALSLAAALILACLGVFQAAANSLPGDPFYGVKQWEQSLALSMSSSPQDQAQLQIQQLRGAIRDLRAEVTDGHADSAILQALGIVAGATRASQSAVAALPDGAARLADERDLASALSDEDAALRQLLNHVDWPVRVAFTHQLGVLGDAVPTITEVKVQDQQDGSVLITLTGTHFDPQARLVINGMPGGTVRSITPTQLVAVVSSSAWHGGAHIIGVLNADGMAAQAPSGADNDEQGPGDNDGDSGDHGTPPPTRTPESGSNDGGHGGSGGGSDGGSGGGSSSGGSGGDN
jgi:uncharacterized membrane protein YgcG